MPLLDAAALAGQLSFRRSSTHSRESRPPTGRGDGTEFGTRYYDSAVGRWTQVDPSGVDDHYVYVGNDPVNGVDPSGRWGLGLFELGEGGGGVQCSWVEETGLSFDFTDACVRHDACYGSGTTKSTCDLRFYNDMKAHCAGRSHFLKPDCYATASTYYYGVMHFG